MTVATLPPYARVTPRQMVATVKIIPYAAPRSAVDRAIEVAKAANQPLISVAPFKAMRAGLVQTRLPGTRDKVLDKAVSTTGKRLTSLGSALAGERRCGHDAASIADALKELKREGCDIYLVAGASAIVDRHDVVPSGIEQAGGKVIAFRHAGRSRQSAADRPSWTASRCSACRAAPSRRSTTASTWCWSGSPPACRSAAPRS